MRLIDADEFINTTKVGTMLASMCTANKAKKEILKATYELIKERIGDAPTIDAVPVRHGEWIYNQKLCSAKCSICRAVAITCSQYCPYCGAKMDGGD